MNDEQSDNGFDDFASAAGAALRRPAPDGGLAGVRSSRQRQRATRAVAVTGVVALVLGASALVLRRAPDDSQQVATTNTSRPPNPESSLPIMTTTTVARVSGLIQLTAGTPMLWADGVFVAAWQDGSFVAASDTTGFPADMLGTPIDLVDRSSSSSTWTPVAEACGIIRLRAVDDSRAFERGYLWSPDYPLDGTLDGSAQANDVALDNALDALGVDPASVDRSVPSVDLDGDSDVEVVIVRYDSDTEPTDDRSAVWLAVWDPATASINTLVGDPVANDTHFSAGGEGPADLDANGRYDTVIDTGAAVTLIELSTGTILSAVDTSCSNTAPAPTTSTTSPVATDAAVVPVDTDRLAAWPAEPGESIPLDDVPQLLPTAAVGAAGVPVRGETDGASLVRPIYSQVFADAERGIIVTVQTNPAGVDSTPAALRRPVTIAGWDDAYSTSGGLLLVASDPGGFVLLSGMGLTADEASTLLETMQRRANGLPGWDMPATPAALIEINGAWMDAAAQRSVSWFVGDNVVAQMFTSPAHTDLIAQALSEPFDTVDVNGATGWVTTTPGTRRSIVWSPDGTSMVVLGVVDDSIDLLSVARSVTERSTADYESQTVTTYPPGVGDGCDGSLFC